MTDKNESTEFQMTDDGGEIKKFKALKDHVIHQNETHLEFKKGESYDGISKKWEPTLKTEKVIK